MVADLPSALPCHPTLPYPTPLSGDLVFLPLMTFFVSLSLILMPMVVLPGWFDGR